MTLEVPSKTHQKHIKFGTKQQESLRFAIGAGLYQALPVSEAGSHPGLVGKTTSILVFMPTTNLEFQPNVQIFGLRGEARVPGPSATLAL